MQINVKNIDRTQKNRVRSEPMLRVISSRNQASQIIRKLGGNRGGRLLRLREKIQLATELLIDIVPAVICIYDAGCDQHNQFSSDRTLAVRLEEGPE